MPRFQFRLETLLKLRVTERDQRQIHLAEAQQAERIIQQEVQAVAADQAANREDARRLTEAGPVNVDLLRDNNRYDIVLRSKQLLLLHQQAQLTAEVQRRHQALVEADRQVKTLEQLREKQLREYQQIELRNEFKQLDETAQRTYRSNARRGS